MDINKDIILEIDKILKDEIKMKKENKLKNQGNPFSKDEILNLLKMEKCEK